MLTRCEAPSLASPDPCSAEEELLLNSLQNKSDRFVHFLVAKTPKSIRMILAAFRDLWGQLPGLGYEKIRPLLLRLSDFPWAFVELLIG